MVVAGAQKTRAILVLASSANRVPEDTREALLAAALAATAPAFSGLGGELGDATGAANELVAALRPGAQATDEDATRLIGLIAGGQLSRMSAARIAARRRDPEGVGQLLVFANDDDPTVRAAAAKGLTELVADGIGGSLVLVAVHQAAADPGRRVVEAVAVTLSEKADNLPDAVRGVLNELRQHRLASVRRAANRPVTNPNVS